MRICFIVGAFPSLSETFILDQMAGLADAGHEIMIYAGARGDEAVVHEAVIRYGFLNRTYFYQDKPRSRLLRLVKFFGLFPKVFCHMPLPALRALSFIRYGRDALSLNLFFRLASFADARDADVVLCHFGPNGLVGIQMKELGVLTGKIVVAFHAADITAYVRRHGCGVYRDLFIKGDRFLPVSEDARTKLLELGCPDGKMRVHAMGVDVAGFSALAPRLIAGPVLRILSVARLVEKKGIGYGLEAVAGLVREGVSCMYTIVGDGPLREQLQARARELGISPYVCFIGGQPAERVKGLLKEADVLVAPSVRASNGDEEGIPVVLMEAMAAGVLVVTTRTGGVGELVVDALNGLIVPEHDVGALVQALKRVCQDPAMREALVAAARGTIAARHDSRVLNRTLEQILTGVAGRKAS